jgi:CRP/FNR family transcriptional regulator
MQIPADKERLHCDAAHCLFRLIGRKIDPVDGTKRIRHIVRKRDQVVYEQGESTYAYYWLCRGRVQLSRRNRHGKRQVVQMVQPGQLFGFEALTNQQNYDEDASALEESQIVFIESREVITELLDKPALATLVRTLAGEILTVEGQLKLLLTGGALERIVRVLLTIADSQGDPEVRLTNEALAAMVGTSTQTVSKCLSRLQHRGLIAHCWGRITILRLAELITIGGLT